MSIATATCTCLWVSTPTITFRAAGCLVTLLITVPGEADVMEAQIETEPAFIARTPEPLISRAGYNFAWLHRNTAQMRAHAFSEA